MPARLANPAKASASAPASLPPTTNGPSRKRKASTNGLDTGTSKRQHVKKAVNKAGGSVRVTSGRPTARRPHPAPYQAGRQALRTAPTKPLVVAVFGTGDCGELGLGPKDQEALFPRIHQFFDPDNVKRLFDVVQLDCGGMHVIALTKDNKIITWGVNDKGALGRDTKWEGGLRDMDADESDSNDDEPLNPFESTPAEVFPDAFQPDTRFVQVAAGDSCSFALTDEGYVYGWGTFLNNTGDEYFGFDDAGTVIEVQRKPRLVAGLKNITQITCGANHALALDSSGSVWGWGMCEQNQLARRLLQRHGGVLQELIPQRVRVCRNGATYIASGLYHSFAVDRKDNVWAWGLSSSGQAGYSKSSGDEPSGTTQPVKLRDLCGKGVVTLSGGQHHSAAVTGGGQCYVWGRIEGGQLGIKFDEGQLADQTLIVRDFRNTPRICTRPTPLANMGTFAFVACGTGHTIFISNEGKAYGAGFGSMGQLGMGEEDEVEVARPVRGKAVQGRFLTWAGAGGQFSLVAGPADANPVSSAP